MCFCGSVLERKKKTGTGYFCAENLGVFPVKWYYKFFLNCCSGPDVTVDVLLMLVNIMLVTFLFQCRTVWDTQNHTTETGGTCLLLQD